MPEKPWKRAYVTFSGEMFIDYNPGESVASINERVKKNMYLALSFHVDTINDLKDSDSQRELYPEEKPKLLKSHE